jgi:hypothetical protein
MISNKHSNKSSSQARGIISDQRSATPKKIEAQLALKSLRLWTGRCVGNVLAQTNWATFSV